MMLHSRFAMLLMGLCLLAGFTLVLSQLGCLGPNYYYLGLNHASAGNDEKAIAAYSRAIELKPDHIDAYFLRGLSYIERGNNAKAIADFSKVIELKSDYNNAHHYRCGAYLMGGNYEQAIADCTKAIEMEPKNSKAYSFLGEAYCGISRALIERGDYDNAIAISSNAIKQYNLSTDAERRRHAASLRAPGVTRLIPRSDAMVISRGQSTAYILRGDAYFEKADADKAIANYTLAIEINADYTTFMSRGNAYFKLGDYDNAIVDFTRMIDFKPMESLGYTLRGNTYQAKGNKAQAEADFLLAEQLKSVE